MTRERTTAGAQLAKIDALGVRWVRGLPHPPIVTRSLAGLSRASDHSDAWIAAALIGAAVDRARRAQWLNAGARVALVEMTSRALKRGFPRQRPQLQDLPALAPTPSPMSFPSSHTAAAVVAMYAFGDELIPKGLLCPLALITGFSRLYLGVHYPSDVAAGAALGHILAPRSIRVRDML
jgi:membrane-associated phospholipid phosphatase